MIFKTLFNKELRMLNEYKKMLKKAQKLKLSSKTDEALLTLTQIFVSIISQRMFIKSEHKAVSNLLVQVADTLNELDVQKALDVYKLALELDPSNLTARITYAKSLRKQHMYLEALEQLSKAELQHPEHREILETKASIYEMMGEIDHFIATQEQLIKYYPDIVTFYDRILKYRPNDDSIIIKKAHIYYKTGRYSEAALTFRKAVAINNTLLNAWRYIGLCEERLNNDQEALKAFKKALKLDSKNADTWVNLGLVYKKMKNLNSACEHFSEAVKLDPTNAHIWFFKGETHLALQQYKDALRALDNAIDLDAEYREALRAKAITLKMLKLYKEELAVLQQLINMSVKSVQLYYELAYAFYKIQDWTHAKYYINEILKVEPLNLKALNLKKDILKSAEEYTDTLQTLNLLIQLEPDNIILFEEKAEIFSTMKDYVNAYHTLDRALNITPQNLDIWYKKASVARAMNDYVKTIECYKNIVMLAPNDIEALKELGMAYYYMKKIDEAESTLVKVLTQKKDDGEVYYLLSLINMDKHELEQALTFIDQALRCSPDTTTYLVLKARIFSTIGDLNKALDTYNKVLNLHAQDEYVWFEKGVLLQKLERYEEALVAFEKSIKLQKDNISAIIHRAEVLMLLKQYTNAIETLNTVLKMDENHTKALYLKATVLFLQARHKEALSTINYALKLETLLEFYELKREICKKLENFQCIIESCRAILAIDPRNITSYRDLANSYIAIEKFETAINTYKTGLDVLGDNFVLLEELNGLYKKLHRFRDSIEVSLKLTMLNPNNATYWIDLGMAQLSLMQINSAISSFNTALALEPSKTSYFYLGIAYEIAQNYKSALNSYKEVLNFSADADTYFHIARIYHIKHRLDQSLKYIDHALTLRQKPKYLEEKAHVLYDLKRFDEALTLLEEFHVGEDLYSTRVLAAKIYILKGEYEQALIALKKALELDSTLEAWRLRGQVLAKLNMDLEALQSYELALSKNPNDFGSWLGKAEILIKNQNFKKALLSLKRAILTNNEDIKTLMLLGEVFEKLGNFKKAKAYYEQVIGLDPQNAYAWYRNAQVLQKLAMEESAVRALDHALAIDPEYQEARRERQTLLDNIHYKQLENYSKKLLIYIFDTKTQITKHEALKKLDIPLKYIDEVFSNINTEGSINLEKMSLSDRQKFEILSLALVRKMARKKITLRLSALTLSLIIKQLPSITVKEAKLLKYYIIACNTYAITLNLADPELEKLLKLVPTDKKAPNLFTIMLDLGIGAYKARLVQLGLELLKKQDQPSSLKSENSREDTYL